MEILHNLPKLCFSKLFTPTSKYFYRDISVIYFATLPIASLQQKVVSTHVQKSWHYPFVIVNPVVKHSLFCAPNVTIISSTSCSILHLTRRPSQSNPSHPLIAYAATSVSDGVFIFSNIIWYHILKYDTLLSSQI